MKKILLLSALSIFACSSDDSNNSNDNNVNDPIVGTWETYLFEEYLGNGEWESNSGINCCITFNSDGTFTSTPNFEDDATGTWQKLPNGMYTYSNGALDEITFYCNNNFYVANFDGSDSGYEYYQKQGFNHQECNEIQYNVN
ncbi:MAG: hypothetical protein ACJ0PS_00430 [Flavobacteriaceae bacterium]